MLQKKQKETKPMQAINIINEDFQKINTAAVNTALTHVNKLVNKQMEVAKASFDRAVSRVESAKEIKTAESALDFQRVVADEEVTELKKQAADYYNLGEEAVNDMLKISEKSYEYWGGALQSVTNGVLPANPFNQYFSYAKQSFDKAQDIWQKGVTDVATLVKDTEATVIKNRKKK